MRNLPFNASEEELQAHLTLASPNPNPNSNFHPKPKPKPNLEPDPKPDPIPHPHQEHFRPYGPVASLQLPISRDTGRHKGLCYVSYSLGEHAVRAMVGIAVVSAARNKHSPCLCSSSSGDSTRTSMSM